VGRVVIDFDGTLAFRQGTWSQCLVDVLDDVSPGHHIVAADLRPHLRDGFPWHEPQRPHLHLSTPTLWWNNLGPLFRRSFEGAGVPPALSGVAVERVRHHYCDPTRFCLFSDTIDALTALKQTGWEVVILSNHVPELSSIVQGLGLDHVVDEVFSSALIGYEKPNPEAFRIALNGAQPGDCYMIGDNPEADVLGAERIGMRAILVRGTTREPLQHAADLLGASRLIFDA
jgi:putative hydrolase of the HAD superfamily